MAHKLTSDQVDALAAEDAAVTTKQIDEIAADEAANLAPGPVLAEGAEGDEVTRLVNLLALLGYRTNDVIKGGPPKLDATVLADVHSAQVALAVTDADGIGPATWSALYLAAGTKLEQAGAGG